MSIDSDIADVMRLCNTGLSLLDVYRYRVYNVPGLSARLQCLRRCSDDELRGLVSILSLDERLPVAFWTDLQKRTGSPVTMPLSVLSCDQC